MLIRQRDIQTLIRQRGGHETMKGNTNRMKGMLMYKHGFLRNLKNQKWQTQYLSFLFCLNPAKQKRFGKNGQKKFFFQILPFNN